MLTVNKRKVPVPHGVELLVNSALSGPSDPCCPPAKRALPHIAPRARTRLWELPTHYLCSIVGTCLTLAEARKFAVRRDGTEAAGMHDLELHERLVMIASEPGEGARDLHKHLDRHHDLAIRRFDKAKDEAALCKAWTQALKEGDIPGAYWAALTHRSATPAFSHKVFGDVHMLSHLVGAANRADVRRLTELERENAELKEKVERQQMHMRDLATAKETVIKRLEDHLASRLASEGAGDAALDASSDAETLRGLVGSLKRRLDQQSERSKVLLEQVARLRAARAQVEDALEQSHNVTSRLAEELATLEIGIAGVQGEADGLQNRLREFLGGRTVFYCGGRPGHIETIRRMVETSSGILLHHDGGQEERKGLVASLLQGADIAFFPVDCVSHDAMGSIKRLCRQFGKPYRALRTSSLACFMHAIHEEILLLEAPKPAPPE